MAFAGFELFGSKLERFGSADFLSWAGPAAFSSWGGPVRLLSGSGAGSSGSRQQTSSVGWLRSRFCKV